MLFQIDNSPVKRVHTQGGQYEVTLENGLTLRMPYKLAIFIARDIEARGAGNIAKLNHVEEAVGNMLLETLLQGFRGRAEKLEEKNKRLREIIDGRARAYQSDWQKREKNLLIENLNKCTILGNKIVHLECENKRLLKKQDAQAILLGEKSLEISQLKKQLSAFRSVDKVV